jgi:hypothetical protein
VYEREPDGRGRLGPRGLHPTDRRAAAAACRVRRPVRPGRRQRGPGVAPAGCLGLRADPYAAARAAGLAVQETGCCSLFTFELAIADGRVSLIVSTAAEHESVLAALGARAESRLGAGA